jgi:hypothetical protein
MNLSRTTSCLSAPHLLLLFGRCFTAVTTTNSATSLYDSDDLLRSRFRRHKEFMLWIWAIPDCRLLQGRYGSDMAHTFVDTAGYGFWLNIWHELSRRYA